MDYVDTTNLEERVPNKSMRSGIRVVKHLS